MRSGPSKVDISRISLSSVKKYLSRNRAALVEYIIAYGGSRDGYNKFVKENVNIKKMPDFPMSLQRLMQRVKRETQQELRFYDWVGISSKDVIHMQRGITTIATKENIQSVVFMNFIRQELQGYQNTGLMTRFRYAWNEAIGKWNRTYAHNHGFHIPVNLDREGQENVCTILGISSASSNAILHALGFNDLNLPWKNARGKVKNKKSKK